MRYIVHTVCSFAISLYIVQRSQISINTLIYTPLGNVSVSFLSVSLFSPCIVSSYSLSSCDRLLLYNFFLLTCIFVSFLFFSLFVSQSMTASLCVSLVTLPLPLFTPSDLQQPSKEMTLRKVSTSKAHI